MSIVSISDGVGSSISKSDLRAFATQLHVDTLDDKDAQDYLTLLRSLETVLRSIDNAPDYIAPDLLPHKTLKHRNFWKSTPEDNPFNGWSHQCDLRSAAPASNLLGGRTVAIKDNISVGGLPTTLGVPQSLFPQADGYPISPVDAVVVSRILGAGGIIKGTSTCESLCASPLSFTSATGPVHNPHLHNYTAGGSSSGSAVLVAAHHLASKGSGKSWGKTVELAIGTDQAGSVRIPASYNGLYGLKPTFGLVPYTGAGSMSPMIDHLGPLAAELEDVAALLEAMAGYDGYDPRMTPETPLVHNVKPYLELLHQARQVIQSTPKPGQGLRVGLLKESFHMPGVAADVRGIVSQTATRYFEAVGASVSEVSIPMHQQGPAIWTAATRPSMSNYLCQGNPSGHLSFLSPHTQLKWPPSQSTYDTLTCNNPAVVNIMLSDKFARESSKAGLEAKAHRMVFALRAAYDSALENFDILVTPCAPTVAMPHPDPNGPDERRASILDRLGVAIGLTSNTCPFNVTGHPGLNVPCGFSTAKDHPDVPLPVGMQIVTNRWADQQLIEAAALFERGREIVQTTADFS
ncbi:Amidase [Penicillium concentricum]|uniref:Amidase n=1 Tax=Penicillium concentricum TaxID=293559 RepID=A0A9W9V952_9EURO|nr:Amidase [Penicillium concentricum]KAJ5373493.1 Amidase [Penicillium concentricum]